MFRNLVLFLFAVLLFSCGKDVVIIEDPTPPVEIDEVFEVNLIGFSTDGERAYVSNAKIEMDNQSLTADETGLFFLEKILVGQKGKIARVTKDGYLPSYHRIANHSSLEEVVVNLELARAPVSKSIEPSGGVVEGSNGRLNIGADIISSEVDFIFQTFMGEKVNLGNDDQLYFGDKTDFLLKTASLYIGAETSISENTRFGVQLEIDPLSIADFSDMSIFHFDESTLAWKQKTVELTRVGNQVSFEIDALGWWTVAKKVPALYGKMKVLQVNNGSIEKAEVDLSFDEKRYTGSKYYTSLSGEISTYFPANTSIILMMNNGEYERELNSGISTNPNENEILISEEVQVSVEGKVYDCDFSMSDGYVAIIEENQHKIVKIEDGFFTTDVFATSTNVQLQFYGESMAAVNTRTSDIESILNENNSFLSCEDLDDNLMVTDGYELLQDFDKCRIKVRPKETVVIGERSNDDVFLVSFEGKKEGVFDGLFYFGDDDILDDVKLEVEVNVILYDTEANKVGGFIKTQYISTGEELQISFIGNIE